MQDLALSVIQGKPFLGHFETTQTNILIIDEENNKALAKKRFSSLGAPAGLPIHISSLRNIKIDNVSDMEETLEYCKNNQISLVIIDSLVRMHSADENSASGMSQALQGLKILTRAGISVILIHHHRKQQAGAKLGFESVRGSSDIFAFVDCHIGVERNERKITIIQDKLRTDEEMKPFSVDMITEDKKVRFQYAGDADTYKQIDDDVLAVIQLGTQSGEEITTEYIKTNCEQSGYALTNALKRLVSKGLITKRSAKSNKYIYALAEQNVEEVQN
jgi:RecA-family ATPase